MKNPILYSLFFIAAFSACNNPSTQNHPGPTQAGPPKNHLEGYPQSSPIIRSYLQYLRSLDTNDLTIGPPALQEFKQRFKGQSPETADTAFYLFWELMVHRNINDPSVKKFLAIYPLDSLPAAMESDVPMSVTGKMIHQKLSANFFIVDEAEGIPYLVTSWRDIQSEVRSYVTRPMNERIAQGIREEKDGFVNDAGLVISPQEYARNAVWWEDFLTRYPHHLYAEEATGAWAAHMKIMMSGMDNTPLFDNDNKDKLNPYFDTVYTLIRKNAPGSRTNAMITPFWKAIQVKDTAGIRKIRDSVENILD